MPRANYGGVRLGHDQIASSTIGMTYRHPLRSQN
jgi:hypothetical protein